MATKILNLDEIETTIEKSFILDGVTHNMVPLSVGEFITQSKRIKELKASDDSDVSEHFEFMVDTICTAFPTAPRDGVRGLSVTKLQMLVDYVNADMEEETAEGNAN